MRGMWWRPQLSLRLILLLTALAAVIAASQGINQRLRAERLEKQVYALRVQIARQQARRLRPSPELPVLRKRLSELESQ
jgi:hypothetical protein